MAANLRKMVTVEAIIPSFIDTELGDLRISEFEKKYGIIMKDYDLKDNLPRRMRNYPYINPKMRLVGYIQIESFQMNVEKVKKDYGLIV